MNIRVLKAKYIIVLLRIARRRYLWNKMFNRKCDLDKLIIESDENTMVGGEDVQTKSKRMG